jgi:hypothetical protein
MCVYEHLQYDKTNDDFKLIADIKDAVGVLTDSYQSAKQTQGSTPQPIQRDRPYLFPLIGRRQLKLQDQNGMEIELNRMDEKCLTSAMVLHEKGKAFIKLKEYWKAVILLAEADNEFK